MSHNDSESFIHNWIIGETPDTTAIIRTWLIQLEGFNAVILLAESQMGTNAV